jgi:hypothetical protein
MFFLPPRQYERTDEQAHAGLFQALSPSDRTWSARGLPRRSEAQAGSAPPSSAMHSLTNECAGPARSFKGRGPPRSAGLRAGLARKNEQEGRNPDSRLSNPCTPKQPGSFRAR